MREKDNHDNTRDKKNDACDHRCDEQSNQRDRRNLVTAKHILLAFLDRAHARAKQSIPENAEDDHHRHHLENGRALLGVVELREDEKESEREKIIKEENGSIPHRQLEVNLEESEKCFHSLVPQTFAGQFNENVLQRRPIKMHILKLEALCIDPFDQLDQSLRRPAGTDGKMS